MHKPTGQQVAIKQYNKRDLAFVPQMENSIEEEIRIMKRLNHNNVVKFYDSYETETHFYIVMQYLPKGSLESDLDPYRVYSEQECKKYFSQLVSAVQHLHSNGILHRDIQLANICLDDCDNVYLCDFGLSESFEPETRKTGFRGNSAYALPESLLGKEYHGPEVDTYALGCCLYKLATGYLPFKGAAQALQGQFFIPLNELDELSASCKDLIGKILCADSKKRYTLDDIINDPWFQ
jgi:serine/threonine protein kinase